METLYLFTKNFPFLHSEGYLISELEYLSAAFDKVVIVPTEYFGNNSESKKLPSNVSILTLNTEIKTYPKRLGFSKKAYLLFGIFIPEFFTCGKPWQFILQLRGIWGMLNYQALCANFMRDKVLSATGENRFYYSYWCHNSCVMLGLLKQQKIIRNFITRGHSLDLYHQHWVNLAKGMLAFRKFKFNSTSALFTVSKAGKKFIDETYPSYSAKTFVSYLGVTDSGENPQTTSNEFHIVSCSSVTPNKRIPFIASMLSYITQPVHWIHFGDGPDKEKVLKAAKKLPGHIRFEFAGQVPNHTVISHYQKQRVDLFINMSEAEGIPVSIMEAISFGIPVLATDVFGNPEVANHETGFTVSPSMHAKQVAVILENFIKNKSEQNSLRNSSRRFFLNNFDAAKNYPSFIQEIKKYKG